MLATANIPIETLVDMELPPLPGSGLKIAALAQDLNTSSRTMADAIGCDPVLAARVLRCANSPMYALEHPITALPFAVTTLGNHAIHMIVIVYAASDTFSRKKRRSKIETMLWEHSVAVGIAAREISAMLGMRGSEEAFMCGLLHDLGKLLMVRHDEVLYKQIEQCADEDEALRLEHNVYGFTHAQVGALISQKWDIPEEIGMAINNHHWPSEAHKGVVMTHVVNVADKLANSNGVGMYPSREINLLEDASVKTLRLSDTQLTKIWESSCSKMREMMSIFN
jgi:putative nucleotidyltransferase with HDIG domain